MFPLTHITHAARAIMLDGASQSDVSTDMLTLALMSLVMPFIFTVTRRSPVPLVVASIFEIYEVLHAWYEP